jgi:predicted RNase H-like HicB family nuclease
MNHYLSVLVPLPEGGWRAHFPDFPGCRAEGRTVEAAIDAAMAAVADHARSITTGGRHLPTPQTFEEVRHGSNGWAAERGIDWSNTVVSLVRLSV